MTPTRQRALRIDDELWARAERAAQRLGLTVSALIRLALVEKLEQLEQGQ